MKESNDAVKKVTYLDDLPSRVALSVSKGASLFLNIASFKERGDVEINVDVASCASFQGAFADFSSSASRFTINVNLLGEGASCDWHLASLCHLAEKKVFITSVFHKAPHTTALMSNYGIARDESRLSFSGISEIEKGAKKSSTRQIAKIIVFNRGSDGLASPILKIGENDVNASHAAVVGRLSEQHLFYLESRGISEETAKRLIALGYLKPIETYFSDKTVAQSIDSAIEGGI